MEYMPSGLNSNNARKALKNYNNRGYSPGYNNRGYPLPSAPLAEGAYIVPIEPNNSAVYKPSGLNSQNSRTTLQRFTNSIFPSNNAGDPSNNAGDPTNLSGGNLPRSAPRLTASNLGLHNYSQPVISPSIPFRHELPMGHGNKGPLMGKAVNLTRKQNMYNELNALARNSRPFDPKRKQNMYNELNALARNGAPLMGNPVNLLGLPAVGAYPVPIEPNYTIKNVNDNKANKYLTGGYKKRKASRKTRKHRKVRR